MEGRDAAPGPAGGTVSPLLDRLDESVLARLVPEAVRVRALDLFLLGRVERRLVSGHRLLGEVRGSRDVYRTVVHVLRGPDGPDAAGQCECPRRARAGLCKHAVALLYAWIYEPATFASLDQRLERLAARPRAELLALLRRLVEREPDLLAEVDAALPAPPAPGNAAAEGPAAAGIPAGGGPGTEAPAAVAVPPAPGEGTPPGHPDSARDAGPAGGVPVPPPAAARTGGETVGPPPGPDGGAGGAAPDGTSPHPGDGFFPGPRATGSGEGATPALPRQDETEAMPGAASGSGERETQRLAPPPAPPQGAAGPGQQQAAQLRPAPPEDPAGVSLATPAPEAPSMGTPARVPPWWRWVQRLEETPDPEPEELERWLQQMAPPPPPGPDGQDQQPPAQALQAAAGSPPEELAPLLLGALWRQAGLARAAERRGEAAARDWLFRRWQELMRLVLRIAQAAGASGPGPRRAQAASSAAGAAPSPLAAIAATARMLGSRGLQAACRALLEAGAAGPALALARRALAGAGSAPEVLAARRAVADALLALGRPAEAVPYLAANFAQQPSSADLSRLEQAARAAGQWQAIATAVEERLAAPGQEALLVEYLARQRRWDDLAVLLAAGDTRTRLPGPLLLACADGLRRDHPALAAQLYREAVARGAVSGSDPAMAARWSALAHRLGPDAGADPAPPPRPGRPPGA